MRIPSFKTVASRAGKYAACLILGVATLSQTARSAPDYATAALSYNPVAFWQLSETGDPSTGTLQAQDSTGNGYVGTYGAASYNGYLGYQGPQPPVYQGFAAGLGAVYCTAGVTNSPVTIPPLNLNTNAVTIAMWINPQGAIATYTGLLMNRTTQGGAAGFGFGGNTDANGVSELGYTWNNNSGQTWGFDSELYPVVGIWQFAALVIQSNSATIYLYYVDPFFGTNLLSAVNPIAHNAEAFSSGGIYLGSDVNQNNVPAANNEFGGLISSAAVYNSALTQDQILALFAAGVGVNGFAPSIGTHPQSRYALSGSPAQLRATVNGTSPLRYQWQLNGTNVNLLANSANFSGANSNVLTILSATAAEAGSYQLIVTNLYGMQISSNATLTIQSPSLVGRWFTNDSLADVSGYAPAGTHDSYAVGGGIYVFTNDVPSGKTGQSVWLYSGDSGIAISNSSTLDASYTNTFDERINDAMTVALWAKGWPGSWNPFASKYGEAGVGWQLRQFGQDQINPCWTVRGAGGTVTLGVAGSYAGPDDLGATGFPLGNDTNSWHFYVGTFDAITGDRHMYIDGQLAASAIGSVPYALSPASYLCIGARDNGGNAFDNFFTGLIYDARVYNYALAYSDVLQLYGVVPPTISVQPKSLSVFAGEAAMVSATVSGTPPLEMQWRLNGTNVNLLPDSANFTGANSNVLTILSMSTNDVGSYSLIVTNLYGMKISSNATVTVSQPRLVGQWFNGSSSLADVSGYQPAGTHDGSVIGGASYVFTNDVPPALTGQSLWLYNADTGIAIQNSSTLDGAYTNTFDGPVNSHLTVTFWAKGAPGAWSWNPWVSKYGEGSAGWQFRTGGSGGPTPCWTVRDGGAGTFTLGGGPDWAKNGDQDDLHAAISGAGSSAVNYSIDNNWHFYAGTFSAVTGIQNLYVDGVLRGQETGNVLYGLAANAPVCIGGRYDPGAGTYGNFSSFQIYDVRIFNYDLTSNQVVAMMPDPVIGVEPPLALNAYIGGTARISASGIGVTQPITNQWQFNGVNLTNGAFGGAIISGADSSTLTIGNVTTNIQGVYHLIVSNSKGTFIGSNTTVTVLSTVAPPAGNLVGSWLTGAADLADTSGYGPAGTHDGFGVSGTTPSSDYAFTSDVPSGKTGQSLALPGTTAIAISNSANYELSYTNTFDDGLTSAMTVMAWAKGWPGGWNPFVSKDGESAGWQLRRNGGSSPCWTVRGTGGTEDMSGNISLSDDGLWHHYAGTFTFDGITGTRILYVDGTLVASQTEIAPYNLSAGYYLCIGGRDNGGNFGNTFTGNMFDVRIYNTALSEAQVNWFMPTNAAVLVPTFSGPPVLTGNSLVLTWTTGTLLQSTNVTGPWTQTGATSPYTNEVSTAPQMYFRLRNP